MTRKDELLQEIETLKNEANQLKIENKIEEALEIVNKIKALKKEVEVEEALEEEEIKNIQNEGEKINMENLELIKKEEKIFENYIRTAISNDMTAGSNAPIIPATISARIIKKVEEMCPIYARATKFNVAGDLVFVKENAIPTADYMDEMAEATSTDATFTTVKLSGFVARALSKISRSLINKAGFDLIAYAVEVIAKSIAKFLEKELINGTSLKITGLKGVSPETVSAINAEALIDLQMKVPSALQGGCEWLMNPADLKTVRKLKDSNGAFLFQADTTAEFGYRVLGKNVMVSDQVPANTVFYGDFSGLYVKLEKDIEVSVLNERYAEQYAVGVVGFIQADANVVEDQKIKAVKVGM